MRTLAIVHQADAGPGVFADVLAAGDTWMIATDHPPADPFGYDAVMTFGGAMQPDDDHRWLKREIELLAELVRRDVPLLGVCLGAELLAEAVGGQARRADAPEIGWFEVQTTPDGTDDPLLAPLAPRFEALEWHSYECVLPDGATTLARSESCLQAFRFGACAWGIQFHAEVTLDDFERWLDDYRSDPDARDLDVDVLRAQTRAAIDGWSDLGRELCARFLEAVA